MKHIKWGKAVLAGLVANVASFIVGGGGYILIGRYFFKLTTSNFWKWTPTNPFNMPFGWYIYLIIGNTLLALIIAVIYAVLYDSLPGQGIKKGLSYGLIGWFLTVLPVAFTISILTLVDWRIILYFTIQGFFESLIYGVVIALVYGEPLRSGDRYDF